MITRLSIAGTRPLRDVRLQLGRLNVITGANGSGQSSLYRALRLLAYIAQGRAIASLAMERGLESALWAGIESFSRGMKQGREPIQGTLRKKPISPKLGFSGEAYGYAIDLELPTRRESISFLDLPETWVELDSIVLDHELILPIHYSKYLFQTDI